MTETPSPVQWPDHEWAGDDDGHNCAKCELGSVWMCDRVAHNIGCTIAAEKILYAIEHMDEALARDDAELAEGSDD
jgi:hypothetical protein